MNPRPPMLAALLLLTISGGLSGQQPPGTAAPPQGPPDPAAAAGSTTLAATAGETLIKSAISALDAHGSVQAKVREQVNLFGHQLVGSGTYLQQGRGDGLLLRMELKVQVAGVISSQIQVCDGKNFWVHEDLNDQPTLGRIDLERVRAARGSRATGAQESLQLSPAIGGLPKLLASLDDAFFFTSVSETRLDRLPVWCIVGAWENARLVEMLPGQVAAIQSGGPVDASSLADHLPDRVRVLLGRDDLVPYRIEYWRTAPKSSSGQFSPSKLLMMMEFFEVRLGAPLDPRAFTYLPGSMVPADQTPGYLKKLGLTEPLPSSAARSSRGVR